MPHRKLHNRGVRQKTFSEIAGVHGLSKDACYTVTVTYDPTNSIKNDYGISNDLMEETKRLEKGYKEVMRSLMKYFLIRG